MRFAAIDCQSNRIDIRLRRKWFFFPECIRNDCMQIDRFCFCSQFLHDSSDIDFLLLPQRSAICHCIHITFNMDFSVAHFSYRFVDAVSRCVLFLYISTFHSLSLCVGAVGVLSFTVFFFPSDSPSCCRLVPLCSRYRLDID